MQNLSLVSAALRLVQIESAAASTMDGLWIVSMDDGGLRGLSRSVRQEVGLPLRCAEARTTSLWAGVVLAVASSSDEPEIVQSDGDRMAPRLVSAAKSTVRGEDRTR